MIITSRKNEIVMKSRGLIAEKKLRDKEGLFAAEGFKLAEEAVRAGIEAEYALVTPTAEEKYPDCVELLKKACRVFIVSDEIFSYVSGQKSPQGIFFAGKILDKFGNLDKMLGKDKILMLDCIQDSGNLGTMLRTAEALGIEGAILGDGCADPFSPKTLRASMGSVFRLPLYTAGLTETAAEFKKQGFRVYAAMLDSTAEALGSFSFPQKSAVIIGNEGHGVNPLIAEQCKKLYIPIKGAESLNAAAAAAIICWQLGRGQ